MKITIKKSAIVKPALETPRHLIWCSNLDLVIPTIHTSTVYFYKQQNGSKPDSFSFQNLKDSLSTALVTFYPIAGRLRSTESGRVDIDCNSEGVLLVEAIADDCMSYYGEHFAPDMNMRELIPKLHFSQPMSSHPILIVQVTWFKCGGVSLGVGLQHTVADGPSALMFINFWGDVARGAAYPDSVKPYLDRTILRARDSPMPKFEHLEYQDPPPLIANTQASNATANWVDINLLHDANYSDSNRKINLEQLRKMKEDVKMIRKFDNQTNNNDDSSYVTDLFLFTKEQVNALKKIAAKSMVDNSLSTTTDAITFTSYEVLSAHIWRCVCRARGLQDSQLSKFYISTDGRSRLRPQVPNNYLGNVIFTTTPMKPVGDLVGSPFSVIAKFIRSELHKMDDEYLRSALDYLQLQPNISTLTRGAHTFRSPNFGLVSWMRLPIFGLDLGWGPPISMGPAGIPFEGQAFLSFAGPHGPGTQLRLSIALSPAAMDQFRKLIYQF